MSIDCDDNDVDIFPGAPEVCNGVDDNCDGLIDDADPLVTGLTTFYADADGDGFGDVNVTMSACAAPAGFVADATDCDDTDSMVNSASPEICNGIDDDCDGLIDDADPSLMGTTIWYADADGDGFGDAAVNQMSCMQPAGFVSDNTDCDDSNANINPAAPEICNGIDDNCNGLIDGNDPGLSGGITSLWYEDLDGDGFGNPLIFVNSCTQPPGFVADGTDCDDANTNVHPNAQEICNGIDDDCDGLIDGMDPNVVGVTTWYADNDGDGFGNPFIPSFSCSQPSGFVANDLDCNDCLLYTSPSPRD